MNNTRLLCEFKASYYCTELAQGYIINEHGVKILSCNQCAKKFRKPIANLDTYDKVGEK